MTEFLLRFLIGGTVVAAFSVIGDLFKPKSFGGLFGASPSVALATLALTVRNDGVAYASIEARSMMVGAMALLVYARVVAYLLLRCRIRALKSTSISMPVWFAVAFAGWFLFLR